MAICTSCFKSFDQIILTTVIADRFPSEIPARTCYYCCCTHTNQDIFFKKSWNGKSVEIFKGEDGEDEKLDQSEGRSLSDREKEFVRCLQELNQMESKHFPFNFSQKHIEVSEFLEIEQKCIAEQLEYINNSVSDDDMKAELELYLVDFHPGRTNGNNSSDFKRAAELLRAAK